MTCCELCNLNYGSVVNKQAFTTSSSNADPIIKQHAYHWIFSKESYAPPSLRRHNIEGWEYIPEYSSEDICVYVNGNYCIIAFRGTQTAFDVYNDIQLSQFGNQCDFAKVRPSIQFIEDLRVMHPNLIIQLAGHSLGGAVARCVGAAFNLKTVTFNAAAPPQSPKQNNVSEVAYHIVFDVISAWQYPCIRIDKGFRAKQTSALYKLIGKNLRNQAIKPMLEAHNIDCFSNNRYGFIISTDNEDELWRAWYTKLPLKFKMAFLAFVGVKDLPALPQSVLF